MEFLQNITKPIMYIIACIFGFNTPNISDEFIEKLEQKRVYGLPLTPPVQQDLFRGIEQANSIVITHAIKHGANVNQSINAIDPLQFAIRHGKNSIIETLLDNGAGIKQHHIDLANFYSDMAKYNLKSNDVVSDTSFNLSDNSSLGNNSITSTISSANSSTNSSSLLPSAATVTSSPYFNARQKLQEDKEYYRLLAEILERKMKQQQQKSQNPEAKKS